MHPFCLLDLTLPSPVEHLALDDALLDELDEYEGDPVLRFWERDRHFLKLPSLLLRRNHEEARFPEPCDEETSGCVKGEQ